MTKRKKLSIIIITAVLSVALIISIAFVGFFVYANQLRFDYTDGEMLGGGFSGTVDDVNEASEYFDRMRELGYYQKFPVFTSSTSIGDNKFLDVYGAINDGFKPYLYETGKKYDNFVKMDYTVSFNKSSSGKNTLTVSFTGFGYPDKGEGEPVRLDRDYIFDITDVDENNMPVLLTEYDA